MKLSNLNSLLIVKFFFKVLIFVALFFNVNAAEIDLKKPLPIDAMITHGKLDNGVSYFIKKNQLPKNKAYIELVIKAGSLMEDDDQQGLAHLLEHMAFNGTKSFPKNQIDAYLNSLGLSIGPDINAYTSFDRTVYKFQVPTENLKYLETGIKMLSEIGSELILDDDAFERERKIIEEEWRGSLGQVDRITEQLKKYHYKDSKYLERDPIGKMEIIRNFPYEAAKRYYQEWYRPELMGIIIVGDIEVKKIENLTKKYFSSIKAKKSAPKFSYPLIPIYNDTIFASVADSEFTQIIFNVLNRQPKLFVDTGVNYKNYVTRDLSEDILNKRFKKNTLEHITPVISSDVSINEFSYYEQVYAYGGILKEDEIIKGVEFLLTEIERIKQNGFLIEELEYAKKQYLKSLETSLLEKNSTQSLKIVNEIKRHYLEKEMLSGIDYELKLAKQILNEINLNDINLTFNEWNNKNNRIIQYITPKQHISTLTKETFLQLEKEVSKKKLEQIKFNVDDKDLIKKELKGSKITDENYYPKTNITKLSLENGVKVLLKPTKFRESKFNFIALSPGGTSLIPVEKLRSGEQIAYVVSSSGLSHLNRTELENRFNPEFISVEPTISPNYEGLKGFAIKSYQKELFELIYLHFEKINYNESTIDKIKVSHRENLKSIEKDPRAKFAAKFGDIFYQNHPRARKITENEIEKISLKDVVSIYEDRFKDASDFTFSFVGDFQISELKPLIEKYLGSLPSTRRNEKNIDDGVRVNKEFIEYTDYENLENQSRHIRVYVKEFDYKPKNRFIIHIMSEITTRLLVEEIREKYNLVYNISVRDRFVSKIPEQKYTIFFNFDSDPLNKDRIFLEIDGILEKIKKGDYPNNYLSDAIKGAITRNKVNKESNSWLVDAISSYHQEGEPLDTIILLEQVISSITKNDVSLFANKTFDNKYIQASLMPKK